ncbi:MAG: DUF6320 domain-containing protein [Lachnospiraceae bacterium]|nr:DUF6320 domain-containing protein [Lachnospiraceae bacterium]
MKKCNFCNVIIKDETDHCPLCGGVLEGNDPGVSTYPNVLKKEKAVSFIFRLMVFISIIASITCIATNIATHVSIAWSLIVTFSFLYVLLILYMFVKENAGYRVRVFGIAAAGVVLIILIDYILGFRRWSVNFVLPSAIILMSATFLLLMLINRRNWQSYALIHVGIFLSSLIPIIMYKFDIVTNPYVSQVAFGLSFVISLGIIILGGPRVKSELYRRFHILGK